MTTFKATFNPQFKWRIRRILHAPQVVLNSGKAQTNCILHCVMMSHIVCCLALLLVTVQLSWSFPSRVPRKVVIAGASSSVGYITFQKLLKKKNFSPVGIVKDRKGYNELRRLGVSEEQIRICDITKKGSLSGVFDGAEQVIICTSAVPRKKLSFKTANFFRSLIGMAKTASTDDFYYEKGQRPYEVDYIGQKNIVDECLRAKVEHVVLLGNMGGICSRSLHTF